MAVTMAKTDGVTVFTLTSDPQSPCPPLCQILGSLCYSPICCSVSQHLRKVQKTSQSLLGTLHIMVGLLNIGLWAITCSSGGAMWWRMSETGFPFYFGGTFVVFGIVNILSEKYPSMCLVILNVILNLVGVPFAIAAIVLYSINIANIRLWWICSRYDYSDYNTPPPQDILKEECLEGKELALMILRCINAVLIVLSVLELCIAFSSAVLGIKALRNSMKSKNKSTDEPEVYQALLDEVESNPTA